MERSNGAVKTAFDIQVNGKRGPGRPKMTWKQLTERDRREWKLSARPNENKGLTQNLDVKVDQRRDARMIGRMDNERTNEICHACSKPVAWKGAHCCGYGPYTCTLIKNPMMMIMMLTLPPFVNSQCHFVCIFL